MMFSPPSQLLVLILLSVCIWLPQAMLQEDSCGFLVISREEMKKEIQAQVRAALIGESYINSSTTRNSTNKTETESPNGSSMAKLIKQMEEHLLENITEVIEEVEEKLDAKLEKLFGSMMRKLVSLHQPGKTPSHPATSCGEVLEFDESTPSGYYWLKASDGSSVRMYCDMTRSCKGADGPWMKVAMLDMTNSSNQCPPGLRLRNHGNKRLCGINSDGPSCSSVMFDTHGIEYSQVCGKIIGYQDKTPDAFQRSQSTIDGNYLDGISLTHGHNPRKHIWSFAAAIDEAGTCPGCSCPCSNVHQSGQAPQPPNFVGNDYFCDTGSLHRFQYIFYPDNPLWDGEGCGPANTCCSLNSPPWFLKSLPSTTRDDIEMRMCSNEPRNNEDIPIETFEVYVQ